MGFESRNNFVCLRFILARVTSIITLSSTAQARVSLFIHLCACNFTCSSSMARVAPAPLSPYLSTSLHQNSLEIISSLIQISKISCLIHFVFSTWFYKNNEIDITLGITSYATLYVRIYAVDNLKTRTISLTYVVNVSEEWTASWEITLCASHLSGQPHMANVQGGL